MPFLLLTIQPVRKLVRTSDMRESKKAKLARIHAEYALLCEEIPSPQCALHFSNPFELLIATVLSAQTTDKRVNMVTPELFATFPNSRALAQASLAQVESIIRTLGFYRVKAQHIIALSARLESNFQGVVPSSMEDLTSLPGVGRKTANVVRGNAFGLPGFPVDTHVMRVTGRLGWYDHGSSCHKRQNTQIKPDPTAIEREITAYFPPNEWTNLSHRLIAHGRTVCTAKNPKCALCPLRATCPYAAS